MTTYNFSQSEIENLEDWFANFTQQLTVLELTYQSTATSAVDVTLRSAAAA
jgi:hypothetical protein